MMLIIRASPLSSCGKNLAKPRYDQKDDQFASSVTRLLIFVFTLFFGAFHQADTLELILKNSCWIPLRTKPWPICKILSNASGSTLSGSVLLVYHHSDILDFLLWNFYLTKLRLIRWPVLKNIATFLRIIVLCYSYCNYHQNDNFKLSPWNCPLAPLWRKWCPICKILSHVL